MQCHLLSNDDYTHILQSLYKTKEVQFLETHLEPISEEVKGYMGEHNNLHVTFKLGTVENNPTRSSTAENNVPTITEIFFQKKKPQTNQIQTFITNGMNAYNKEIFFYDYLLKEYEKYGCDVTFAPKCIYVVRDEALILENLTQKGFVLSGRHKILSMAQIECALQAVAKFHGAGIIYDLKKTAELQRKYLIVEEFPDILEEKINVMGTSPTNFAKVWWNGVLKTHQAIINQLPGDTGYKQKFASMVSKFELGASFAIKTNYLKTCGHGDLWPSNMMFKWMEGRPIDCRLLDFQACRHFYPAFDVVMLVFGATTPSFRKNNLQKCYRCYYECLASVLAKQGYQLDEIMSFNEFLDSIKLVLRDVMLQVLFALSVSTLPKEILISMVHKNEELQECFFDNGRFCAEAIKTDENYRNIITEAFQEYYNILISYE